jgi:hypothetical protein
MNTINDKKQAVFQVRSDRCSRPATTGATTAHTGKNKAQPAGIGIDGGGP